MLLRKSLRLNWYYMVIAFKDSYRARTTLLTNAVIFAGICLLILLLIGLKSGLVQQFYDDIMKSPSATEGKWFATSANQALDRQGEKQLLTALPPGAIVIPEITKIVTLTTATGKVENVTLQATVPRDPFLAYYGVGIANNNDRSVIVSPEVARELGIDAQQSGFQPTTATVTLRRIDGDQSVKAELQVTVVAVIGTDESKIKSGYLSRYFMDQIEDFSQGETVSEHGWPGQTDAKGIGHQGYLAFTKRAYNDEDITRLHLRGLKATKIGDHDTPSVMNDWRSLHGLLNPDDLHTYFLTAETQTGDLEQFLDFNVSEIEDITNSDDVLLYWSKPLIADIDRSPHRLVGVSGSLRWLKSYFVNPQVRFTGGGLSRVMLPNGSGTKSVDLRLSDGSHIKLDCLPPPVEVERIGQSMTAEAMDDLAKATTEIVGSLTWLPVGVLNFDLNGAWSNSTVRSWLAAFDENANAQRVPLAIVPTELLSAIHRHQQGTLAFDAGHQRFHRVSTPNKYFSGRIYARVLEDVPVIDEQMQKMGYSTISSKLRVLEMQGYAGTLDLLVNILQVVAVLLGVATVSVVFMEVTRRRKTSIAIMRIMGMESQGIFLFVFVRAILIACLGWSIACVLAIVISWLLPLTSAAECRLAISDFVNVFIGAIACAAVGIVFHAWHAATHRDIVGDITLGKVQ
jgi:hypothetical protein